MYKMPNLREKSYTCPHCGANAGMEMQRCNLVKRNSYYLFDYTMHAPTDDKYRLSIVTCRACDKLQIWLDDTMIFPKMNNIPEPNESMSDDIKGIYKEAANVFEYSPRASAALLRLAVQKLCKELGEKGNNIDNDIGELVKKGLPEQIQMALDSVRVIGNNAVHPGSIDLNDNKEDAKMLFSVLNFIIDRMIREPKEVEELYGTLPKNSLAHIEKRDNK